jgi:hypothetical protein
MQRNGADPVFIFFFCFCFRVSFFFLTLQGSVLVVANNYCMASANAARPTYIADSRSVIRLAEKKAEQDGWVRKLMAQRNKNVRIVWALLAKDRMFRSDYTPATEAAGV